MAIGSVYGQPNKNSIVRGLYRMFGTPDYHSHLRLKPLFSFLKRNVKSPVDILELGCGGGGVLIETCLTVPTRRTMGVDIESDSIAKANTLREQILPDANMTFVVLNALDFSISGKFDTILLMDVLEHVEDTKAILGVVRQAIRPGGLVLVSVPTPLFPKVFGRDFHNMIGHVRDGFTKVDVEELFQDFSLLHWQYNTGPLTIPFCALYYRVIRKIPFGAVRTLSGFVLLTTAWLDIWHPQSMSCSLFLAFQAPDSRALERFEADNLR